MWQNQITMMVQKLYRHGTLSVPSWKSDFSIPVPIRNFTPVQKFFTMKAIYNTPQTPPQYFIPGTSVFYTFYPVFYTLLYPFIPGNKMHNMCPWRILSKSKMIINPKQDIFQNYTPQRCLVITHRLAKQVNKMQLLTLRQ